MTTGLSLPAGQPLWRRHQAFLLLAHAGLLCLALVPLAISDIPALVDYPNHLARMRILMDIGDSPGLQAIYEVHWSVIPNLAMDAIVPPLARIVGLEAAGRIFISMTLLALAGGTVVLHRVLHGRIDASSLLVYLVLYNYVTSFGFLNYLFGIGLGMLLLALWVGTENRSPALRLVAGAAGAVLLFFCHLQALAVYGLCVASYELSCWWRDDPRRATDLARRLLPAGAQFLPAALLVAIWLPAPTGHTITAWLPGWKLMALFTPTLFYRTATDIALLVPLLVLLVFGRRLFSMARGMVLTALALAVMILLVPTWLTGNWGNDFRLAVPLVLLLIAGCRLRAPGRRATIMFLALVLAGLGLRVATLSHDWIAYDRLFAELRSLAQEIPEGSALLPVVNDDPEIGAVAPSPYRRPFHNVATVLLFDRAIFMPSLFTGPGRQIVSVRAPWRESDLPHMPPMPVEQLVLGVRADGGETMRLSGKPTENFWHLAGWPDRFDLVLVFDFGRPVNPLPDILELSRRGRWFSLYAIRPPGERGAR